MFDADKLLARVFTGGATSGVPGELLGGSPQPADREAVQSVGVTVIRTMIAGWHFNVYFGS